MGAIDALSAAVANMREGDDPRLSLEVALLKVARPALDSSQEALLRRIETARGGRWAGQPRRRRPTPKEARRAQGGVQPQGEARRGAEPEPQQPLRRRRDRDTPEAKPRRSARRSVATHPAASSVVQSSSGRRSSTTSATPAAEMLSTIFEGARPMAIDAERAVLYDRVPVVGAKFTSERPSRGRTWSRSPNR